MHIRSRDDCLAECDCVAQGSGCRLLKIEIGGHVDIAGFELVQQFTDIEKAILPENMIFHAEFAREFLERIAVDLALCSDQIGMGGTDDPV